MATFQGRMEHAGGIPLGGLGTGSVEIRPDGYFHEWQIFNLGRWAPKQPECCQSPGPDLGPGALAFFLRTQTAGGPPLVRRLGVRADQHDLYSQTWLKSVRAIEFEGRYPVARLAYQDEDLPVSVSAAMFSPFIPHDARTSGTPGCHIVFRVRNRSEAPVEVSILGVLQDPLAHGLADRRLRNAVTRQGRTTYLTMRTSARAACGATIGSLGLSLTGGDVTFLAGEFAEFARGFRTWSPRYGYVHESLLLDFRRTGRLRGTRAGRSPARLLRLSDEQLAGLSDRRVRGLIARLSRHPFAQRLRERVEEVAPRELRSAAGRRRFLAYLRQALDQVAGKDRARQTWGDGALASTLRLAPLQEEEFRFTLGWHFPNHYSARGPIIGHMYERWFKDAEAVNRFLAAGHEPHRRQVVAFADALYDTTLPPEFADAWAGQLSTLAKCTWWTKRGDFAVWEGLGCCGFHTTDITYQGSFGLLALFPELQQRQMAMGARFQRADGRVHHFFTPDLAHVDEGFDRVDMNPQFGLLVCRDYLWTGDRRRLKRLWPHVVRAMDNSALLDADGDGLPDHATKRNTYDAWNFFGTPSYIASLWLGALRAASRLAEDLGDRRRARAWRRTLRRGAAAFEKKLWNGRYYSLWVGGRRRDECCMTDQVDGEWFTHLIGLGHALPRQRITAALRAIVKQNFRPEEGLINASYPPGARPVLSTYRNVQAEAPWTGIEYAIASMMLEFGLVAEGAAVVRNIHQRYARAGRFWNHVECGDHYYRAMASWAVLLAATGFKPDVPRGTLTIAPVAAGSAFRAPWVSATGWGRFAQGPGRFELACEAGGLEFRELRLAVEPAEGTVRLNGRKVAATVRREGDRTVVRLRRAVRLRAGDRLTVGN